ncbi:uncharacterized protein BDZ99DRAFT_518256 [Mytilinidion resinicola]|uniref:HET-domain-containing protein n=1 Tax=Mytilinidion resinicola TaxID=574789 RepID=A0A6A6YUG0_9PEZI|nr:uncharacterized protein BDZ99DRAFT_518256 [Mytilinidion resinicola]KAF2812411.1 hypothetical protein BDZ99DRAFT_518256 [Mytilinidion resinicola]
MKSISMMESIYRNAAAVVSIDQDLLSLSTETSTWHALAIRFLTCDWNRRLWTFQEAILVKQLYAAFKVRTIKVQDLSESLKDQSNLVETLLWELRRLGCTDSTNFTFKLMMLQDRSSSVRRDEALVIATIAGLDMNYVTQDYLDTSLQDDETIKSIWLMISRVHHSILFNRGDKLAYPGFRFAPRSFMVPCI